MRKSIATIILLISFFSIRTLTFAENNLGNLLNIGTGSELSQFENNKLATYNYKNYKLTNFSAGLKRFVYKLKTTALEKYKTGKITYYDMNDLGKEYKMMIYYMNKFQDDLYKYDTGYYLKDKQEWKNSAKENSQNIKLYILKIKNIFSK